MIPTNITKAHLEQAIAEIDRAGVRKGRHSSTYDLIYESKAYPPKLVISIANRFANGEELDPNDFEGGKGTKAFELLKTAGFEIVSKQDPLQQLIETYKVRIAETHLAEEVYKWEAVSHYRGRPNTNAPDFYAELKGLDFKNLIYHMARGVLHHIASEHPEEIRQQFIHLYDESNDLTARIKAFYQGTLDLYRGMDQKKGHYQDERSIAGYLTYHNPEKYTFYKSSFYTKLCKLLGIKKAGKNEKLTHYLSLVDNFIENYIALDQELIEQVKALIPDYYDGIHHKLLAQDILFQTLETKGKSIPQTPTNKKYWLYAPGENASSWDEFYEQGIMVLGWDELGDLNKLGDKDDITKVIQTTYNTESKSYNNALANLEFRDIISIGDIIIPKKGRQDYLGYGIVTSDYYFDPNRKEYQHCRKVDWKKKGGWPESKGDIVLKTLTDITKYPDYVNRLIGLIGIEQDPISQNEPTEAMNFPLNTIFYGPPGTGKTYNTLKRAAEIVEDRTIDSYEEAQKVFKSNLHQQIEFITFHQNYSYEDFIQGLRPDTENNSELTFERKDGVFKEIADKALRNLRESEQPQLAKKQFEAVFNQFITPLIEGDKEEIEVKMKKVSYFITAVSNKSIDFRKASGGTAHSLSIATLKKMYEAESILDIQGLASYYTPLLELLLKIGKDRSGKKERVVKNNYIIIIDEINRANISRVFGELITLIEPDKRSHGKIPMEARLPSGDKFMVPSNLFIIGTMNTADKSIALLDIALRRRFEFEAMYPNYDIPAIHDVGILQKINEQIITSKGHDFQIGHAYFMGDDYQLVHSMNKKIIPLLLEYYMNDEKEVKKILSSAGLKIEKGSWPLTISGIV